MLRGQAHQGRAHGAHRALERAVESKDGAALLLGHQLRKQGAVVAAAPAAAGARVWQSGSSGDVSSSGHSAAPNRRGEPAPSPAKADLMDRPKLKSTAAYTL